jgi:hypothetical protein
MHLTLNLDKLSHANAEEGAGTARRYKQRGDFHKSVSHMKGQNGTDLHIPAYRKKMPKHFCYIYL